MYRISIYRFYDTYGCSGIKPMTTGKVMNCRCCKAEYEPIYKNGILVSKYCIQCLIIKGRAKREAEWKKTKKALNEKLKTKAMFRSELQIAFNRYIRLRDKNKGCISCGRKFNINEKFDAGHFFSVGAYPNLRYDEDNVHGQCVRCNQHLHGNIAEYAIQLPKRIGYENYGKLLDRRNKPLKLSIEELARKTVEYKLACKKLEVKET